MGNRRSRTVHHHHHDDSRQRDHEYRMQQSRNASAQAARDHDLRVKQFEKQKQLEMEREKERQKEAQRQFEEKMKKMKFEEKKQAIHRVKTDRNVHQRKYDVLNKELTKELKPKLEEAKQEINKSKEDITRFTERSTKALAEIENAIKLQLEKYDAADGKIKDAIKTTNVDEGNIPRFLTLINDGLLFATMQGQVEQDRMTAKLKVFGELIERTASAKLSISMYFKENGLQRLTLPMAEEGYLNMDDIKCSDNAELTEIYDLLTEALQNTEEKKSKQKLNAAERRKLKTFCTKFDKSWVPDQKDKEEIVRKSLIMTAPKLSNFFGVLHGAIAECNKLLTYESKLTSDQQKAIEAMPKDDDEKKADSDPERKHLDKGSECLVYSKSADIWCRGRIVDIMFDDKGEWLTVQYAVNDSEIKDVQIQRFSEWIKPTIEPLDGGKSKEVAMIQQFKEDDMNTANEQCQSLGKVVIHKLHIAEALSGDFEIDQKEVDAMDAVIKKELEPKQKELEKKKDQMDDIQVELAEIEAELDEIEEAEDEAKEEEADEDDDDDDDSDDSDKEKDDDKEDFKKQKKECKKKRKKLRLKQKKLELTVQKIEKKINVIESRRGELISASDVLSDGFSVAKSIEDSCLQIIKSQCAIRQSILLARELLKYKPAKPSAEAKPLWDTIIKGIGDIFENALELSQISSQYFAFFIKFQSSFNKFVVANKQNKNVSLMIASEYLVKDVSDIQVFQKQIDGKVEKLRTSALETIRNCVSKTAGADELETSMTARAKAEEAIRDKNKEYDAKKLEVDNNFQEKFANSEKWEADKRKIQYQMQEIQKDADLNKEWIITLNAQLAELESLNIT